MKRGLALSLLLLASRSFGLEVPVGYFPRFQRFVHDHGSAYGLALIVDGVTLARPDRTTGRLAAQPLTGDPLYRLIRFIETIPDGDEEDLLAGALRAYLDARENKDPSFERLLFDPRSAGRLTRLGRAVVMDILTADDGILFEESDDFKQHLAELDRDHPAPWPDQPDLAGRRLGVPMPAIQAEMAPSTAPILSSHIHSLGFDALWKAGMTGAGVSVAVLDSGLDLTHPDYRGRVIAYDNVTDTVPFDTVGHGTHVTGILAGGGEGSGGGYPGGAPNASLAIFKVVVLDSSGTARAPNDNIVTAMRHAAEMPAGVRPKVMNVSLAGQGDPDTDIISQMANLLMLRENIFVVAAAGNQGPSTGTVEAPGNAAYILTVGSLSQKSSTTSYSASGPVQAGAWSYVKPDLAAVGGDGSKNPCVFAPDGVVAPVSSLDKGRSCRDTSHPRYRYWTGTSMASPMGAAAAADVIGYLLWNDVDYKAIEVKALMEETAHDLKLRPERQGSGRQDGARLAEAVERRVREGVPIGNVAYMVAARLTSEQRKYLSWQKRYQLTPLGLLDTLTGRLLHTDAEIADVAGWLQRSVSRWR
jgi:subtilisin family serine protease